MSFNTLHADVVRIYRLTAFLATVNDYISLATVTVNGKRSYNLTKKEFIPRTVRTKIECISTEWQHRNTITWTIPSVQRVTPPRNISPIHKSHLHRARRRNILMKTANPNTTTKHL